MMHKVSANKIISVTLLLFLFVFSIVLYSNNFWISQPISTTCVVIIFNYIIMTYAVYSVTKKMTGYILFLILSFVFYFGQHLVVLLNGDFHLFYNILTIKYNEIEFINEVSYFALQAIILTTLGFVVVYKNLIIPNGKIQINISDIKALRRTGQILLVVSSVPTLMMLLESLRTLLLYGYANQVFESIYANATGSSIYNILKIISFLIIPSFIILLIAYKNTKMEKNIFILVVLYCGLYVCTGSRMNACLLFITYIFMKQRYLSPFSKKEIIRWLFLSIAGLFVVTFISSARSAFGSGNNIAEIIKEFGTEVIRSNFILRVVEEMGTTFFTLLTVIKNCPSAVDYKLGETYFNSLLGIIPNLFWEVHPASINTDAVFKGFLYSNSGMGSSYITEAFWNFGKYCLVIMPLFGAVFAKIENKIDKGIRTGNIMSICISFYIFYLLVFFLRSDTITFWRDFVYYGVTPAIIYKTRINKRTRRLA